MVMLTLRTQAPALSVTVHVWGGGVLGLGVSIEGVFITSLGCRLSRGQERILVRSQRPSGYSDHPVVMLPVTEGVCSAPVHQGELGSHPV